MISTVAAVIGAHGPLVLGAPHEADAWRQSKCTSHATQDGGRRPSGAAQRRRSGAWNSQLRKIDQNGRQRPGLAGSRSEDRSLETALLLLARTPRAGRVSPQGAGRYRSPRSLSVRDGLEMSEEFTRPDLVELVRKH